MKKIFTNNFALGFLVLAASTLSLIFAQQQVLSAWQAPVDGPGDNGAVSIPLTIDTGNVDVADNNLINVADLRVETLTATTSVNVLGTLTTGTFNTNNLGVSDLTIPYGSGQGVVDITAVDSSIQLNAANSAIGAVTKAAYFTAGSSATGGASYGLYAATNALSAANTNYAVAAVSNNAGGTAVYGLANSGWAGYFSGPVGVAGAFSAGNNVDASGLYSVALGHNTEASGDYSFAGGNLATASGSNSFAFGSIAVSGLNSFGINLNPIPSSQEILSQDGAMSIMGGNLGINTTTPSYKLHLVGDYYQVGMMQVRPTTALVAGENIFYGNAPTGSNNSANLLLLQNDGVDKFKVTALGTGTFASSISATQGSFSSGIVVSGSAATINVGATVGGTLNMKSGGIISFNSSKGSYFDFNDDDGTGAPACAAGTAGVVYNFKVNNVLCYCNGTAWFSMVNGKADALCATK